MKNFSEVTIAAVAGLLVAVSPLHAVGTAQLRISANAGVNWVTVKDGNGDGLVSFSGSIGGNWSIAIAAGSTKPALGTSADPVMNLSANSVSSLGSGTLIIEFSDTFYGPLPTGNSFKTSLDSGNAGSGTTAAWSYLGAGDTIFQKTTLLGTISETGAGGGFPTVSSGPLSGYALFSLTTRVAIYHDDAGVSSFNAGLVDPPGDVADGGATVALLGFALLALAGLTGWMRRRRTA